MDAGFRQDVDYMPDSIATGPMVFYVFNGAYDALYPGFVYWLVGQE